MVAMVIGMLGIMGALVWKLTQTPSNNPAEMMTGEIELPSGFEIINVSRSGSRLFIILENHETGERLLQERGANQEGLIGQYQIRQIDN